MLWSTTAGRTGSAPAPATADTGLRVLFDVSHPAQAHLFRNAIAALEARGHETFVTSREKEVTVDLLDAYDVTHEPLTSQGGSVPGLVAELLAREVRLLAAARRFDPDVIVSRLGPVPAHVSAVLGSRWVVVSDTRVDRWPMRLLFRGVTFPFVDTICAPESFDLPVTDEQRRPLDFQELAYLRPRYFEPDPTVLEAHGIDPGEPFFVLRVVGWDAYHDVGYAGLSPEMVRRLVELLSVHGAVYVSAERELPADLAAHELPTDPEDVLHVLRYADLYVGDSATMSTEAALLGTPAIRTNTMVGDDDENVFRQLESRYGLLRSFADEAEAFRAVEQLVGEGLATVDWEARRERLLAEQPDVTERMVEVILESDHEASDQ